MDTVVRSEKASDREARRFARLALIKEEPQEYPVINELALSWGRNRIILFSTLLIGLLGLCVIGSTVSGPQRGSPLLLVILFVNWLWRGGYAVRHYTSFKRKLDLRSRHASADRMAEL